MTAGGSFCLNTSIKSDTIGNTLFSPTVWDQFSQRISNYNLRHFTENISFPGQKVLVIVPTEFEELSSLSLFKKAIK